MNEETVTGRMSLYRIWQQLCIALLIAIAGWMATNIDDMKTMMAKAMTKIEQHEKNFLAVDRRFEKVDKHFQKIDEDVSSLKVDMATLKHKK